MSSLLSYVWLSLKRGLGNYLRAEVLRRMGRDIPQMSRSLCHIIASGMFNAIFEVVIHDMPYEQALRDVEQLQAFYTAGWSKLMGE